MKIKKFSRRLLLNFLLSNSCKINIDNINIFFGKKKTSNLNKLNIKDLYIIISKKIKGSVKRNKIKRLMKNIIKDINNKTNNLYFFIIFLNQSFEYIFFNKENFKKKFLNIILYDKK